MSARGGGGATLRMCWQGLERPFVGGGRGDSVLRNAPQPLGETEAMTSRPTGMCWFTVAFLVQDLWQTVGRLASYVGRSTCWLCLSR